MRKCDYSEMYDIDLLRKKYNNGEPIKDIIEYFDISVTKLYKIMNECGIEKNRNVITPNYTDETFEIFKEMFCSREYIPFTPNKKYERHPLCKYNYDESYFDNINTPEKSYILGLLYADGSMCPDLHRATISLQEKDVGVLSRINTLIKSDKPLTFVKSNNDNWQSVYRLDINNRHMCDALVFHGVIPNKSLKLTFPKNLPFDLYKDFLRGYIDGDGTIKHSRPESVSFTSTKMFCDDAKIFIENNCHVNCFYGGTEQNGITTNLCVGGYN